MGTESGKYEMQESVQRGPGVKIRSAIKQRWFLSMLLILIPAGLLIGWMAAAEQVQRAVSFLPARVVTATVLFLMAFSLNSSALKSSLRRPGPVLWASWVNLGLVPLAAIVLMKLQTIRDYQIGLMIAASVPCTMASCSVWTRKAGGNDAVSLLVTMLTNGVCFLVTPFWIIIATRINVDLGFDAMVSRLAMAVLVPCLVGQLLRLSKPAADFAIRNKTPFGVIAQSLILVMVFAASCRAGSRLQLNDAPPGVGATVFVLSSCIALHLGAMLIGVVGARMFGVCAADRKAIAFASSQKTLPVGVLLAEIFSRTAGVPFVVFPMLMYHASQLFIDTAIADRYAKQPEDSISTS